MSGTDTREREVAWIPLAEIHDDKNVRRQLGNLEGLTRSIGRWGVLSPIGVERREGGGYTLVVGHRRFAAAGLAEAQGAPAVIFEAGEPAERILQQLAENCDRLALEDLEMADAVQEALDLGAEPESVAVALGTSPDIVEAWRAVAALPAAARELVATGRIPVREAYRLTAVADDAAVLGECIRRIGYGHDVAQVVRGAVADRERNEASAATRQKLEASGCRIIECPTYGGFAQNSKTQRLGHGYGEVRVAKRAHAKLPCHAAFIDREGKAVFVCTDRNVHAGVEGTGVPDLKAERAAKRAERKALLDAHALRFGVVRDAVQNHAIGTREAVAHILRLFVSQAQHEAVETAVELLGLPVPEQAHGYYDTEEALLARAREGDDGLVEVALAVAFAAGEHGLTTESFHYSQEAVTAHVKFLAETGIHQLSAVELQVARTRGARDWGHGAEEGAAEDAETDEEAPAA